MQQSSRSRFVFPPERGKIRQRTEQLIGHRETHATDQRENRSIRSQTHTSPQRLRSWKELGILEDRPPRLDHPTICDRTIDERKDLRRIVVPVQTGNPFSASRFAHRQRQFASIAPLIGTRPNLGIFDSSLPYPLDCVMYDSLLRTKLRIVRHVLNLTAATPVARVMRAR